MRTKAAMAKNKYAFKRILAGLLLSACPILATAADAPAQLRHFVESVKSATGHFTQQVAGARAGSKPPQSGEFAFRRPGQFKWAVQKPYEQLIVSDGKVVFQYDPDLNQATQRSVDDSIGASPAAILFGSGSLDETFTVASLPDSNGLQWLRATPRSADAGFNRVDIGFKGNMPARLELLDSFGQTTRIDLTDIVANPALPKGEFTFVPPKGVDIVKM